MNKNLPVMMALTLGAVSLCKTITDRLNLFNDERDGAANPWIRISA